MAMLAEPKRRQKLSTDPRNKAWSNDKHKFGQQLMEKMGWQQGKGLGVHEDGKTTHITVALKNNSVGLGCSQKHEDNWISHQDDFNDLLSSLNQDHNAHSDREPTSQPQKLQEKSKKAKRRVHYSKFTRGKDLSACSSSEMNCIMGVRSNCSTPRSQSETNSDSEAGSQDECTGRVGLGFASGNQLQHTSHQDDSFGVKTITSSSSIQEYFAQKMKELKQKRRAEPMASGSATSSGNSGAEDSQPSNVTADADRTRASDNVDSDVIVCHHKEKTKTSKRKRKKLKQEELSEDLDSQDGSQDGHGSPSWRVTNDNTQSHLTNGTGRTKKKKKNKCNKDHKC